MFVVDLESVAHMFLFLVCLRWITTLGLFYNDLQQVA